MRILIIEDEKKIAEMLVKGFNEAGFTAESVANGQLGLELAIAEDYDLLIVDVMLPSIDGFSLVEKLREFRNNTPIIFLSAKRSTEDRIEGLQKGADDYVVKPFSFSELLLRVRTILKRSSQSIDSGILKYEDLELNLLTRKVKRSGKEIELHHKEFLLLEYLLRHKEQVLTKTQILEKVWQYDFDPQTNVVDVLVCRLRAKIDKEANRKLIKTVRGVGYAIRLH